MANWSFLPPSDTTYPLESRPILTVWTRVSIAAGSTVVQNPDTTWTQYDRNAPQTATDPANKFFFGPGGFSGLSAGGTGTTAATVHGAVSSAQMGFATPLRVYLGGHRYVINDAFKAELVAAVTAQHPTGYGAYIFPAATGAIVTGDEITASGYTATQPAHSAPWGPAWNPALTALPAWTGITAGTWQELIGQR